MYNFTLNHQAPSASVRMKTFPYFDFSEQISPRFPFLWEIDSDGDHWQMIQRLQIQCYSFEAFEGKSKVFGWSKCIETVFAHTQQQGIIVILESRVRYANEK